jgi:hypothetical protein
MTEPSEAAESIWKAADYLGHVKIAWHNRFSTEELKAADLVLTALMRIGGEVKRGEA